MVFQFPGASKSLLQLLDLQTAKEHYSHLLHVHLKLLLMAGIKQSHDCQNDIIRTTLASCRRNVLVIHLEGLVRYSQ